MITVLSLIRESGSMEHYVSVEVQDYPNGILTATVSADVPERYLSHRYGEPDIEFTGDNLFNEGDDIELTDAELEEAREALSSNLAAYNAQKASLIDHLRPENIAARFQSRGDGSYDVKDDSDKVIGHLKNATSEGMKDFLSQPKPEDKPE